MSRGQFHAEPFDEGTLTKLEIFQLYTREWLPVFLAGRQDWLRSVHLYDFFAGPGCDPSGVPGSPLRTMAVLKEYSAQGLGGWGRIPITVHLSDSSQSKIDALGETLKRDEWQVPAIGVETLAEEFERAFAAQEAVLADRSSAKLVLLDQFGVSQVTSDIFRKLTSFPCTDFLFFISSSTLQRFREHPAIKQKITRSADFNQVHQAALAYYHSLLPKHARYYLAPFSIKKGSNIYGVIFGSAHPLGMDKFLNVAWNQDRLNGTANFDINRDEIQPEQPMLDLGVITKPHKLGVFEQELERLLRARALPDEFSVAEMCFSHGVMRSHASPVLSRLKQEGVIACDFRTPDWPGGNREPRAIRYLKRD